MPNDSLHGSAICWRCRKPYDECNGSCTKKAYIAQTHDDKTQAISALEQRIGQLSVQINDLITMRSGLEVELRQLINPPVELPVRKLTWVPVHQFVPCWRCKRPTKWRNPNGGPEHLNGNCPGMPGGMTFNMAHTLDGLLSGSIDPDELLRG